MIAAELCQELNKANFVFAIIDASVVSSLLLLGKFFNCRDFVSLL